MAKWVSLIVKFGALVFIVFVPLQYAIQLQLLGGIWIIQTLPSVLIGLYTRWFNPWALLIGWAAGTFAGTYMAAAVNFAAGLSAGDRRLDLPRLYRALHADPQSRHRHRADAGDECTECQAGGQDRGRGLLRVSTEREGDLRSCFIPRPGQRFRSRVTRHRGAPRQPPADAWKAFQIISAVGRHVRVGIERDVGERERIAGKPIGIAEPSLHHRQRAIARLQEMRHPFGVASARRSE